MEVFKLINEEGILIIIGYHYFITSTDIGNECQWLLTSQIETNKHYMLPDGSI